MKLRNIVNKIKRVGRKPLVVAALALTLVAVPTAIVVAGFGPERPTYDYNKPCDPNDGDPYDRCGSLDGPVFNSFVNTPTYGDERNFVRTARVVPGQSPAEADYTETQVAQPGQEYWVRTFVHNNANVDTNASGLGIARDTRVKLMIPDGTANGFDVMTQISASNAKQSPVWDTATLANDGQQFSVSYVPGSATIFNPAHPGGLTLSDQITSANGTNIGYNAMNGDLPGCFEFSAYVYVRVRVEAPQIEFEKQVRLDGQGPNDWRDEIHAQTGDRVEYVLDFLNTGTDVANDLVLRDRLPSNMELVPGTVEWVDSNRPDGTPIPDSFLFADNGLLVGNYGVNGGGYIYFDAVVKENPSECVARNVAFIRGNGIPEQEAQAVVIIDDCVPDQPAYSCDALTATQIGDRAYRYDVRYTAQNGATLRSYTYNFGDNTTPLVTDQNPVNHTYAQPGDYMARVTLTFDVNGEERTATSDSCAVLIRTDQPQPVTPGVLPNTGAGEVIGIFVATTIAGMVAYRFVWVRRYNV